MGEVWWRVTLSPGGNSYTTGAVVVWRWCWWCRSSSWPSVAVSDRGWLWMAISRGW